MKKRKSFGVRIIGKPFQFDGDQYAVIKTKMGYYGRIRGKKFFRIGNRHKTSKKAREELMDIYKVAKQAKKLKLKSKKKEQMSIDGMTTKRHMKLLREQRKAQQYRRRGRK